MEHIHLKPIGLKQQASARRAAKPAPSLSCSLAYFSYPIIPETPRLDATAKADVQKRAAA